VGAGVIVQRHDAVGAFEAFHSNGLPRDIHVFGPLKKALNGCTFSSDDNVQEAVVQWSRHQPKEFFADGIRRPVDQWNSYLNARGDFLTVAVPSPVNILELVSF
jgi:hypothetical protein